MSIATGICSLSLHSIGRYVADDVHYNVMPVRSVFRSVIEQTFKEECPCILVFVNLPLSKMATRWNSPTLLAFCIRIT